MAFYLGIAKGEALFECYPQRRKKRGIQSISTRRRTGVPKQGWFTFNGRPAFRKGVGRPALPAGEWIRREEARRRKRNKTGRTNPSRRKPIKLRSTKHPRPARVMHLHRDPPQARDVWLGNADTSANPDDWFTPDDLDPEVLLAGLPALNPGQV